MFTIINRVENFTIYDAGNAVIVRVTGRDEDIMIESYRPGVVQSYACAYAAARGFCSGWLKSRERVS